MPNHHEFPMHQQADTAPEESRSRLEAAKQHYGFIPNLMKYQAEAPQLLEAYQTMNDIFERTSLTPVEQQVVHSRPTSSTTATTACPLTPRS